MIALICSTNVEILLTDNEGHEPKETRTLAILESFYEGSRGPGGNADVAGGQHGGRRRHLIANVRA